MLKLYKHQLKALVYFCLPITYKRNNNRCMFLCSSILLLFVVLLLLSCAKPFNLQLSVILMYTKQLLSKLTLPDFNQLQRSSSSSAISERTLEECWTTLQRVSWILFNRVAYSSSGADALSCLILLLPAWCFALRLIFFCLCQMSLGSFCFRFVTNTLNRFVYTLVSFVCCYVMRVWTFLCVCVFFICRLKLMVLWTFFELSLRICCWCNDQWNWFCFGFIVRTFIFIIN